MAFSSQQLEAAFRGIDGEAFDSVQIVTAERIAAQYYPHLDPGQPALLLGLTDRPLAERIRLVLSQAYPPEHPVTFIARESRSSTTLAQLAEQPGYTPATALLIPPIATPAAYEALQDIVAHLRAPEGCPWDRELTWSKLRSSLLEEAHEFLAALDTEDEVKVKEELGDLLLQIGMQAQIATEDGRFRFGDVVAGIIDKLIRRHPHVFGDTTVSGTAEVLANWEAIKAAERKRNGEKRSPLSGIPKGLPALAQADAYLDRMSRACGRWKRQPNRDRRSALGRARRICRPMRLSRTRCLARPCLGSSRGRSHAASMPKARFVPRILVSQRRSRIARPNDGPDCLKGRVRLLIAPGQGQCILSHPFPLIAPGNVRSRRYTSDGSPAAGRSAARSFDRRSDRDRYPARTACGIPAPVEPPRSAPPHPCL